MSPLQRQCQGQRQGQGREPPLLCGLGTVAPQCSVCGALANIVYKPGKAVAEGGGSHPPY